MFANDFYNMSGFRDLVLHVQEHTYTLLQIDELLSSAGLRFIGFDFMNNDVLQKYKTNYPDDKSCTNLNNWHSFEQENKDTFLGMHIFWCQKL